MKIHQYIDDEGNNQVIINGEGLSVDVTSEFSNGIFSDNPNFLWINFVFECGETSSTLPSPEEPKETELINNRWEILDL